MRINVYAEEITEEVQIVGKRASTGRDFYAVRLMLESSPKLHHAETDDDRSAITFWIPSDRTGWKPGDGAKLRALFRYAIAAIDRLDGQAYHATIDHARGR